MAIGTRDVISSAGMPAHQLWSPSERLSPRIKALRDQYWSCYEREYTNEVRSYTTGTSWDIVYSIWSWTNVPEVALFQKGFRSYLDQGLFLGEHMQVIHVLLVRVYLLWPSHLLLELVEAVALGSCAIPAYWIAVRHGAGRRAAMLLALDSMSDGYVYIHTYHEAILERSFR